MSEHHCGETAEFDRYAVEYDDALAQGLSVFGENKQYFAGGRVAWLAKRLAQIGFRPSSVIDFGCGIGSTSPFLMAIEGVESFVGVDVSAKSLAQAVREHHEPRARFALLSEYEPSGSVDLAFSNGVFHHIPPAERLDAVRFVNR